MKVKIAAFYILTLFLCAGCTRNTLAIKPSDVQIVLSEDAPAPLRLAAETLSRDFEKVTGYCPEIVGTLESVTAGKSIVIIDRASDLYGLQETDLKPLDDFESHRVWTDPQKGRIYLDGFDMRGAIYAIYTFDEEFLGVPPLWFWCSWTPEHKNIVRIPADTDIFFKSPQVRYRAWLPNDADLYDNWKKKSEQNREIVYETMLRLKLNTFEDAGVTMNHDISDAMKLTAKYGMITTSHHMFMMNLHFGDWRRYWTEVRGYDKAPELLLSDISRLREFWEYGLKTVIDSGVENIWNISLRGSGDQPMWALFKDAPKSMEKRGKVITRLLQEQVDLIKKYTGDDNPVVRVTFYDEMADLVSNGLVTPPSHSNMIWTFCSGRRDHYPYSDIQNMHFYNPVHLGYYMNLQFSSTGSHLAPGEGPWKMEFNYRYLNEKSPLYLSVLNAGNFREFLYTLSANAEMLWDYESYDSDKWNREYAVKYFGKKHADEVADLYHDYFHSYWSQRNSDFPGGMERQFIFHDHRHARAIEFIAKDFFNYNENPLPDYYLYERVKGRVFRVIPEDNGTDNQVDALIKGMKSSSEAFGDVAVRAANLMPKLESSRQTFFYDNLLCYALYMQHLSKSLYHYVYAYKYQSDKDILMSNLKGSYKEMESARNSLLANQHPPFDSWYESEKKLGLKSLLSTIEQTIEKVQSLSGTDSELK